MHLFFSCSWRHFGRLCNNHLLYHQHRYLLHLVLDVVIQFCSDCFGCSFCLCWCQNIEYLPKVLLDRPSVPPFVARFVYSYDFVIFGNMFLALICVHMILQKKHENEIDKQKNCNYEINKKLEKNNINKS